MTPHNGRVISFHCFQHYIIQFGSRHPAFPVGIYIQSNFHRFEYSCFFFCRNKNNGHIVKRCQSLSELFFIGHGGIGFFLHQVPLINEYHNPLPFFYGQAVNIQVLSRDTFFRIQHQQAYIRFVHCFNGTDYGVKLQVFMHFCFTAYTRSIDKNKFFLKKIIMGVNGIACSAGNITHNRTLLSYQRIQ